MPRGVLSDFLDYLYRLYPEHDARSDGDLLERFVTLGEDAAFTSLVRRHGRMVENVCRRILGDRHSAEDCFQATFIILARQAASIRSRQSLGTWLYAIAQRVARKAQAKIILRRQKEREAAAMPRAQGLDEHTWQELRSIIDEEIGRLPEKYQAPLVLCHLEGKSHARAAKELGCPKTTLERRLSHGQALLHRSLIRRGVTLSAGALATALGEKVIGAPVSALLVLNTAKAAVGALAGKTAAGACVTAQALALAEEAMVGMAAIKSKVVVGLVLAMVLGIGVTVGGVGLAGGKVKVEVKEQVPVVANAVVAQMVEEKKPRVDRYGDELPEGAVARLGTVRFRHEGSLIRLAFAQEGKALVGCTYYGVHIWDAATGKERYRLPAGPLREHGAVFDYGMDISPDGYTLAVPEYASGRTAKIVLWDLRTGDRAKTFALPKEDTFAIVQYLRFTPDGNRLALLGNDKVIVLDLPSGRASTLGARLAPTFHHFAISPDSKKFAASTNARDKNGVQLWDLTDGAMLRPIYDFPPNTESSYVTAMAFSADGKLLAFGSKDQVCLAEVAADEDVRRFEAKMGQINGLAFMPDGKALVTGSSDGKIRMWNVDTGSITRTISDEYDSSVARALALSPDGKKVALGTQGSAVRIWDVETGKELFAEDRHHEALIRPLAFSPDGKTLVSASTYDGQAFLWDSATKKRIGKLSGSALNLAYSPDGKLLARSGTQGSKVMLWDNVFGREASALGVPNTNIFWLSFSTDGRKLFTIDKPVRAPIPVQKLSDVVVRHWDVASGNEIKSWKLSDKRPLFMATDGKTVIGLPEEDVVSLYDLELGREKLLRDPGSEVLYLALSPDARILACGMAKPNPVVKLWELVSGKVIATFKGQQGNVTAIAWSADGRLLALGGGHESLLVGPAQDKLVRILDTASGKELARFANLKSSVTSLAIAPDGKMLVAGFLDSTILVFDLAEVGVNRATAPKLAKNQLESNWTDLSSDDTVKAHQAIWRLADRPNESVSFLARRLRPIVVIGAEITQKWIAELHSDNFRVRQTAMKALEGAGAQAQARLQAAIKSNPPLEAHRRLEQILNSILDTRSPETLRTIRAIMVLERIGSLEAKSVLETLAKGAPGARETEEARASLERLKARIP